MTPNKFPLTFRQRKLLLILLYSLSTCIFLGSMILSAEHVNFVNKAVKNSGIGLTSEKMNKDLRIVFALMIVASLLLGASLFLGGHLPSAKTMIESKVIYGCIGLFIFPVLPVFFFQAKYIYDSVKIFDLKHDRATHDCNITLMLCFIIMMGGLFYDTFYKEEEIKREKPNASFVLEKRNEFRKVDNYEKKEEMSI